MQRWQSRCDFTILQLTVHADLGTKSPSPSTSIFKIQNTIPSYPFPVSPPPSSKAFTEPELNGLNFSGRPAPASPSAASAASAASALLSLKGLLPASLPSKGFSPSKGFRNGAAPGAPGLRTSEKNGGTPKSSDEDSGSAGETPILQRVFQRH